jgi:hypothetical protein
MPTQSDLIHRWVQQHRRMQNYIAATRGLRMTPQEQYAYRHHLSNLDRGGVPHDNGSLSSFLNITVGFGDKTYLIPTVWDNKIVSEDEAIRRARASGLNNWPSYPSLDAANARYNAIHGYMERDTERKLNANPVSKPSGDIHPRTMERPQPAGPEGND